MPISASWEAYTSFYVWVNGAARTSTSTSGLPAGVLNVVTGRGSDISDALLADPRVAALTFAGSNEVSERLRTALASRNVRFQAEDGREGSDPAAETLRHEVFGPVIVVSLVDGVDAAIDSVNDSDFGLAAAVFTPNLAHANRFADEVECGQIAVNTTTTGRYVHHPFGGFRDSGSAFKEQGEPALDFYTRLRFYTRVKMVAINYGA